MQIRASEVVQILKNEYGITTLADLNKAIESLGKIDISPFCAVPKSDVESAAFVMP